MTKADDSKVSRLRVRMAEDLREAMSLRGIKTGTELAELTGLYVERVRRCLAGDSDKIGDYEQIGYALGTEFDPNLRVVKRQRRDYLLSGEGLEGVA